MPCSCMKKTKKRKGGKEYTATTEGAKKLVSEAKAVDDMKRDLCVEDELLKQEEKRHVKKLT